MISKVTLNVFSFFFQKKTNTINPCERINYFLLITFPVHASFYLFTLNFVFSRVISVTVFTCEEFYLFYFLPLCVAFSHYTNSINFIRLGRNKSCKNLCNIYYVNIYIGKWEKKERTLKMSPEFYVSYYLI